MDRLEDQCLPKHGVPMATTGFFLQMQFDRGLPPPSLFPKVARVPAAGAQAALSPVLALATPALLLKLSSD